jgi:pyrroline-5-carboxylate reductase
MELLDKKVLFIGCGNMGSAILKNLLRNGFNPANFSVLKPSQKNIIPNISYKSTYQEFPEKYQVDIIVFAFKPQNSSDILNNLSQNSHIYHKNTIFISILAGKKVNFFEELLGKESKIIRLMPNLPTLINQGIFGYYGNSTIANSELFNELQVFLDAIGENILVDKEDLIDCVTAISGSGPAYLFLFIKTFIDSATNLGLSQDQAKKLVKQTVFGSAKMALDYEGDMENIIDSVVSRGGTTEVALEVFQKDKIFQKIFFDAANAAKNRAEELSRL